MKVFDFIIHSSIYLAFAGACLVYASCLLFGVEPKIELTLIMFLSVYAIYNFSRITDRAEDEINVPDRVSVFTRYEKYLTPSIPIAYIGAIFLAYYLGGFKLTLAVLMPLILIIIYAVRWIPRSVSKYSRLKEVMGLKNIIASLAWAWIATFLPFAYYRLDVTITMLVIFIFIFIISFINTVFFDMRDIEGDKLEGINTIPVYLGFNDTIKFLIILNAFLGVFILFTTFNEWVPTLAYITAGIVLYYYECLYLMTKIDTGFVCDVLIDGDVIFVGILALLGTLLF